MRKIVLFLYFIVLVIPCMASAITVDELIDKVLAVRQMQFDSVNDLVCKAEQYEKKADGDGNIKETKKLIKTVYVKKIDGRFEVREDFEEYYLNGQKQDAKALADEVEQIKKDKKRRGNRDLMYDLLAPLLNRNRIMYSFELDPVVVDLDGFDCYQLSGITAANMDTLLNYKYYFDTASYHLVKADFKPAQLTDNFFFKLKEFDMVMTFEPYNDSLWVPYRFKIAGNGKAMLFIGVNFEAEEIYLNPRINVGLPDSLFTNLE